MDGREYWKKREEENLRKYLKTEADYIKTIHSYYDYMLDQIKREINGFYAKYARAEGITMAEAKRKVAKADIAEYERKAAKYVQDKDFSKEANDEMRLYNATMKINRLEMLKSNIGLELVNGFDDLQKYFDVILTERTRQEFERQAGILGKTIQNNEQMVHTIVNASYAHAKFSDRIWMYQDMMKAELSKLLRTGLIQGRNPRKLATHLEKLFGVRKRDAERLMRTELARVQIEAQKQSYERNGYDQYVFIALGTACKDCAALDNGKPINIADMMPGTNAPPIHPNCRCSTAAYMDKNEFEKYLEYLGDSMSRMPLNLQYFALSNKQSVLQKIKNGEIDRDEFKESYNYFKSRFKDGIETPIGKVSDTKDRFYHIVDRHVYMMSKTSIDKIVETLSDPLEIRMSKDKFGNSANCYIKEFKENTLLVLDRNGIITSYEPNPNYLQKIKGGELLWKKN